MPDDVPLGPTPNSKTASGALVTPDGPLVMTALTTGHSAWFSPGEGARIVPSKSPLTTRE